MTTPKKTILALAAFLAVQMLLASSCGDEAGKPAETLDPGTEAVTESQTEGETQYVHDLDDGDFGGQDVNMYIWSRSTLPAEEETGETINDAILARNNRVEDEYNVNFKYNVNPGSVDDWGKWLKTLQDSVLAGDDAIQLAGGYGYRLASASLDGSFLNFNDMPHIDFSQPWWPSNINEAGNLGGNLYMVLGNFDTMYYDVTYVIYFNKVLANELDSEDFYQLVRDGKWTIDKLIECAKGVSKDMNGDGVMDMSDRYGYVTKPNMEIDAYLDSCMVQITDRDADNLPFLVGLTQHYTDVQSKVQNFVLSENAYYTTKSSIGTMFEDGLGLFTGDKLERAHEFREMKDDFGIIPYPKWDEAQEDYRTYNALGNATSIVIPNTADPDMMGLITEALAFYGWRDVLPEYYEKALKGKAARDNESEEMLDLVFNKIHFDFTQFYSYAFGDEKAPSMLLRISIRKSVDMASQWAADQSRYDSTMAKLIEQLS